MSDKQFMRLVVLILAIVIMVYTHKHRVQKNYCTVHFSDKTDFDMCMLSSMYLRVK